MRPLSALLKEWRLGADIPEAEAARRCHLSRQLWRQLEDGISRTPHRATLYKLARGTGLPVEILATASYAEPVVA